MAETGIRRFNSPILAPAFQHKGIRSLTATTTVTRPDYSGRTLVLNAVAGFTVTLPAALGTGRRFRFVVGTALTSGSYIIKVANATDVFAGGVIVNDAGDTANPTGDFFPTAASSDTLTLAFTSGAGDIGDWIEFEDFKSGFFAINGAITAVADPAATPFSATV